MELDKKYYETNQSNNIIDTLQGGGGEEPSFTLNSNNSLVPIIRGEESIINS